MDISKLDNATLSEKIGYIYENDHPLWAPLCLVLNSSGLGFVDRFLSKKAIDFELRQIRLLISELKKYSLTSTPSDSPDLIPALRISINAINESLSKEKVRVFASILANLWNQKTSNWDATSQTLRLVRDLEDIHFLVLSEAHKLHNAETGRGIFSVGGKLSLATCAIEDVLPSDLDPMLIDSCVSDLIAKGLLNDSFISNNSLETDIELSPTKAPVTYSISDLGIWLIKQITPADLN
ncbi:hypothetical protein [Pseudomonas vanderleydeniana]|uniref:Uncharacterized protein n=1 Tax=Pseudomonas vanderleydeniana TaxID=2745495 RepID=A0A9E6PHA1_9PSED|nr:hypothetical protein [Pseudomonas vanderleydeniana]QXI26463.1 hypothetical protein HU752_021315 [Pseudomonas vanderleydeniana]